MTKALITGITGQDGSYLAELLLDKGYEVFGVTRVPSGPLHETIAGRVPLMSAELSDEGALRKALASVLPDEIYHLAAQSVPRQSLEQPIPTADTNGLGTLRLLEGVRQICPTARFYYASTSEVFGTAKTSPQDETTEFAPRNPYGAAKVFGHMLTAMYRDNYGMHASCGILYNHESPRRGAHYVTSKISRAAAEISLGLAETVQLGDLTARRDWGFAGDYVKAMWSMLQQSTPSDYVIGSGETHSVRELCELAFAEVGLDYRDHIDQHPELTRPPETTLLQSNPARAARELGWRAETTFNELISMMVQADLARASRST